MNKPSNIGTKKPFLVSAHNSDLSWTKEYWMLAISFIGIAMVLLYFLGYSVGQQDTLKKCVESNAIAKHCINTH